MIYKDYDYIEYGERINFDVLTHIEALSDFFKKDFPLYQSYLLQQDKELDQSFFERYYKLLRDSNKIIELSTNASFSEYKFVDIFYFFEDKRSQLQMVAKTWKFLRVNITNLNNTSVNVLSLLSGGTTIENLIGFESNLSDVNNNWATVAINNLLLEVDYGAENQNNELFLPIDSNNQSFKIRSVLDSPIGEKVLGLDLNRRLTIVDNDYEVLTYKDTYSQSFEILIGIKKGDLIEFPEFGLPSSLGNTNILSLSIFSRQLAQIALSDDSFSYILIKDFVQDNSKIFLSIEAASILNDLVSSKIVQ